MTSAQILAVGGLAAALLNTLGLALASGAGNRIAAAGSLVMVAANLVAFWKDRRKSDVYPGNRK